MRNEVQEEIGKMLNKVLQQVTDRDRPGPPATTDFAGGGDQWASTREVRRTCQRWLPHREVGAAMGLEPPG